MTKFGTSRSWDCQEIGLKKKYLRPMKGKPGTRNTTGEKILVKMRNVFPKRKLMKGSVGSRNAVFVVFINLFQSIKGNYSIYFLYAKIVSAKTV